VAARREAMRTTARRRCCLAMATSGSIQVVY
jgi:hypothetical protein